MLEKRGSLFSIPQKIVKKNPKDALEYLNSLKIECTFDLWVFLNQFRTSRQASSFNFSGLSNLPKVSIRIKSSFNPKHLKTGNSDFSWKNVCKSFNFIVGCFNKKPEVVCKNIDELLAFHIISEFLGHPVFCYWDSGCFSKSWFLNPNDIQKFFPWESQRCIHICNSDFAKRLLLGRGLNPALVLVNSRKSRGLKHAMSRLCSDKSLNFAKKYLKISKEKNHFGTAKLIGKLSLRKPYLAGLNKLAYFSNKVSLENSVSFNSEEQIIRRNFFEYAKNKLDELELTQESKLSILLHNFIDCSFYLKSGKKLTTLSDCSFAFRRRNPLDFAYYHFTEIELKGAIDKFINTIHKNKEKNHLIHNYKLAISKISENNTIFSKLAQPSFSKINDSPQILKKLGNTAVPLFCFLDGCSLEAFALSVLNPLKKRIKKKESSAPVYVFSSTQKKFAKRVDCEFIDFAIKNDSLLKKCAKCGLLKIAQTKQISGGINLLQLSKNNLMLLYKNRNNGLVCSFDEDGLVTSNNLNINWMSIGKIKSECTAALSGLKAGERYAIINLERKSLFTGFPLVNKTILDMRATFTNPINSPSIPSQIVKKSLFADKTFDGAPISGNILEISNPNQKYEFGIEFFAAPNAPQKMIRKFELTHNKKVLFAWNGGYFIDKRVTKRENLPSHLLNSPLGLLKINQEVLSLPLFNNRPALAIDQKGNVKISYLNVKKLKLTIQLSNTNFNIAFNQIDPEKFWTGKPALCTVKKHIQTAPQGFIAIKFLFNKVIEVLKERQVSKISMPSFTLLIPKKQCSNSWAKLKKISFTLGNYKNFGSMIEAGPVLIKNSKISINLEKEGWTSTESKAIQFSLVHSLSVRTSRTAFCILKGGKVATVTINGRTVESIGATHLELAKIIKKIFKGKVLDAMEFDCGGSVSLLERGNYLSLFSSFTTGKKKNTIIKYPGRSISTAILLFEKV
ncbi:MAG: phosphodiester glycosidase family protein [Candidatus Diapherotrites archaeon]|nr:phosphodiester glycosidase family protein [Candidatus Diapherotrites archaeon]